MFERSPFEEMTVDGIRQGIFSIWGQSWPFLKGPFTFESSRPLTWSILRGKESSGVMKEAINSIHLAYDDHGAGLPIIFLHAFPLNRGMWANELTSLLSDGQYRVIALDWRGFGESETTAGNVTMEQLARDLAGLMDHLGIQEAVLCGLSMGGYVAFAFYRAFPERVRALILADTQPYADNEEAKTRRETVARLAESDGTTAIANLQIPNLLSEAGRREHPDMVRSVERMIDAATPQGIAAAARGMALRADSTDLLEHISCPALVLVGEQDMITPPRLAQDYAAKIPGAQFVLIPQAGHLSNMEQSEKFLYLLRSFLSTLL